VEVIVVVRGFMIGIFGYVGDGNLYFVIVIDDCDLV